MYSIYVLDIRFEKDNDMIRMKMASRNIIRAGGIGAHRTEINVD